MDKRPTFARLRMMVAVVFVTAAIVTPADLTHAQQTRQSAPTIEALAAKVQHLQDIQDITAVLIEYGRALDARDFKAYSGLFAKDGSWSGGMGSVSGGPQAVYDFMTSRIGRGRAANAGAGAIASGNSGGARQPGGAGSTYHIMSNFNIAVNGDTATAASRWTFVSAARGPGIQLAGRYEDKLVRENGAWKFQSRQAFNDVTAPAASTSTAGSAGAPAAAPAAGR